MVIPTRIDDADAEDTDSAPPAAVPHPAPTNYGVDLRGRTILPSNGLPLEDKGYHAKGHFPSDSRHFLKNLDSRQFCVVSKQFTGIILPYTEGMDIAERKKRVKIGKDARKDLRSMAS